MLKAGQAATRVVRACVKDTSRPRPSRARPAKLLHGHQRCTETKDGQAKELRATAGQKQ